MNNDTQEIAQADWATFAADFTKEHQGKMATLEALDTDLGDQYAAENLPFVGITMETKGSDAGALIITLGTEEADTLERHVQSPKSLQVHATDAETVLQIQSSGDEPTFLLHLMPAA